MRELLIVIMLMACAWVSLVAIGVVFQPEPPAWEVAR